MDPATPPGSDLFEHGIDTQQRRIVWPPEHDRPLTEYLLVDGGEKKEKEGLDQWLDESEGENDEKAEERLSDFFEHGIDTQRREIVWLPEDDRPLLEYLLVDGGEKKEKEGLDQWLDESEGENDEKAEERLSDFFEHGIDTQRREIVWPPEDDRPLIEYLLDEGGENKEKEGEKKEKEGENKEKEGEKKEKEGLVEWLNESEEENSDEEASKEEHRLESRIEVGRTPARVLTPSPDSSLSPLAPMALHHNYRASYNSGRTMSSSTPSAATSPRPRNIVILLDGTGNQVSAQNSNVIKTLSILQADEQQLVYYSSGVGTVFPSGTSLLGKIGHKISVLSDEALAWNFDDFVCDAYKFLMDYHNTGDRVYIFGFSRGAYTARALAGMVQKVGLLPPGNHNQVKLAYEIYKTPNKEDRDEARKHGTVPLSTQYRRIFGISRPVQLHFIGVWDTVSSLGGVNLPRLPFASSVQGVTFFRQALSLDERRARFKPEYHRLDKGEHPVDIFMPGAKATDGAGADGRPRQNVECWFMGCHSDVGGGEDQNFTPSLSNIPFRWMIREAAKCDIRLDASQIVCQPAFSDVPTVKNSGIIPEELRKLLDEMSASPVIDYEKEKAVRALIDEHLRPSALLDLVKMAAAYDTTLDGDVGAGAPISPDLERLLQQSLTPKWYILEFLPLDTRTYTDTEETNRDHLQMNLFQGRQIIASQYIHRSVQKRFRYDKPLNGATPTHSGRYNGPAAALPNEWGTTWEELRGGGPDIWED